MAEKGKQKAILVGITGGFLCGKTTAINHIKNLGFPILISDMVAEELMENDSQVRNLLIYAFGNDIFNEDSKLRKQWLAEIVFGDSEDNRQKLMKLEQIVHPRVIDYLMQKIEELDNQGHRFIFVESALIYEAGLEEVFDYVITIHSEQENIIRRAIESGKYTTEQAIRRLNSQMTISKKIELSDFAVANNNTSAELIEHVDWVVNIIKQAHNF